MPLGRSRGIRACGALRPRRFRGLQGGRLRPAAYSVCLSVCLSVFVPLGGSPWVGRPGCCPPGWVAGGPWGRGDPINSINNINIINIILLILILMAAAIINININNILLIILILII